MTYTTRDPQPVNRDPVRATHDTITLAADIESIKFRDASGDLVGMIVRRVDGKPVRTGVFLDRGPRTVEIEYRK